MSHEPELQKDQNIKKYNFTYCFHAPEIQPFISKKVCTPDIQCSKKHSDSSDRKYHEDEENEIMMSFISIHNHRELQISNQCVQCLCNMSHVSERHKNLWTAF
jgi:hypothetical protein